MSPVDSLLDGFATALQPEMLLFAAIGITIGTLVGVLPGIGPALTIALLLPITLNFEPTAAFIMFAGVYYGGMYGGSTTSILLNTPGEAASVVTTIEGFQMAKRGRGGAALATAAIGSFVAGTISTVALTFAAPAIAEVALLFQPADYFALMVMAFVSVTALLGRSLIRGMVSLLVGLLIGLVGIDVVSGQARYTMGVPELLDGLSITVVAVALFAVGEALSVAARMRHGDDEILAVQGSVWMTRDDWRRSWKPWLRGAAIGFPIGALPAGGADVPTFLSYATERAMSKHKEEFGHGAIEGVAGPEAANNAAFSGVLVPLLTMGLPTSATAAIMLAAFQIYNLQPGPLLFQNSGDLVWAMIASLYIGNVMLLVLNLPMVKLWVKLLEIPRPLLFSSILVIATLAVYASANSTTDLIVMFAIGFGGFLMRRFDLPIGPMILAVILGPLMEAQYRRAMSIGQGDLTVFIQRPLSATILGLAAVALVAPYIPSLIRRARGEQTEGRLVIGSGDED
jgi:putative tricarboxylic transport membrane protein